MDARQTFFAGRQELLNARSNLWAIRLYRSITRQKLGSAPLTPQLIGDYETGRRDIATTHLPILAERLGVSVETLLAPPRNYAATEDTHIQTIINRYRQE